ncbi:hypothetical protein KEJ23_03390 [Candidatus Bathyarchaeota archaeon]|nr:hypothetical protein [Candidatus Bathyarchaeota archaeon]
MLIVSPATFATLRASLSLKGIDTFFIIGIVSLLALLLADRHTEVMILFFIPALSSFTAFAMGYFPPLLSLASGYVFTLPIFILLSTYQETSPETFTITYLFSLLIAVDLLCASKAGSFTPTSLFYPSLLLGVGNFQQSSISMEFEYQIFSGLIAISLLTTLWRSLSRTSYKGASILFDSHVLLAGLIASAAAIILTLTSKIFPELENLLPLLFALGSISIVAILFRLLFE